MAQLLFLWGRENPDYGYKQGMNEILAVLLIIFDAERIERDSGSKGRNWDEMTD